MKRSHHCNQLRKDNAGSSATLIGWIDSLRDHGGVFFLDLRDREGKTQVVLDPENQTLSELFPKLKPESVIEVSGEVRNRDEGTENSNLSTGDIELFASCILVHNQSKTPPFPLDDTADKVGEDLRLTYRYLDLRRQSNLNALKLRHQASMSIRKYFDNQDFLEIETPMLFKSTPEGAREFLVPSRMNEGKFYALPQSPQQYKQMLMVAGIERYYQLARCFRDEDLRADRQPEFTQIDLEMSFIDREDMYALIEGLLSTVWKDTLGEEIKTPFLRMPYHDAMNRFGSDKPDMRFSMEIQDFSEDFRESGFKVFAGTVQSGGSVKAFNAKGLADITQGELKHLEETAKSLGAKGLAFIKSEGGEWKSPILKFLSDAEQETLKSKLEVGDGDIIFFAAGSWDSSCNILGRIRLEAAILLEKRGQALRDPKDWKFLWVIDFPLMHFEEEEGSYVASHHPFTAPVEEDLPLLESEPKKVRGQHYDIVLNGVELGGGSIRIHQPDVQKKIFEDVLNIPADVVKSQFGYMLESFEYGAPPHGGIALGLDRLITILAGKESIRDVIAFPKTQKGQDLMTDSPGTVTDRQLRDLKVKSTAEDV
jgi:aspartyl-tRNA synthetase